MNILLKIKKRFLQAWWAQFVAYFSLLWLIYAALWTIAESNDVPILLPQGSFMTQRRFYLIVFTLILAPHVYIIIRLLINRDHAGLKVVMDDVECMDLLLNYIEENSIAEAKLVQYSGDKVKPLIKKLLEKNIKVYLLLHDPISPLSRLNPQDEMNKFQKIKRMAFMNDFKNEFKNPENLHIYYYDEPASLKAVKLDKQVLALGSYTYRSRSRDDHTRWLYGHCNPCYISYSDSAQFSQLEAFFDDAFISLLNGATPLKHMYNNWKSIEGVVVEGHGVASKASTHYPSGTIQMQLPFFKRLGLDLSSFHLATLNIDVKPRTFAVIYPEITFHQIEWTDNHPPENFSFSKCIITFNNTKYDALIYYPHPETKKRHFQSQSVIEVIAPFIPDIASNNKVEISVNPEEVFISKL